MSEKYYVVSQLTNDKDQDASTITFHETLDQAKVEFHGKKQKFFQCS